MSRIYLTLLLKHTDSLYLCASRFWQQDNSQFCITISYINTDAVFLKTMKTLHTWWVCIRNQQTCLCPKEKLWPQHNGDVHCITTVTYVVCLIIMDVGEAILVTIPILHTYRLCFLIFPYILSFLSRNTQVLLSSNKSFTSVINHPLR